MPPPHQRQPDTTLDHALVMLRQSWLNWLLLFIPVSLLLKFIHGLDAWLFVVAAFSLIPLAGLIGTATEELSVHTGPVGGGILNAAFGNATELIVALFALRSGLHEVVKASISGSIISNILLVLGMSMLTGGWRRPVQRFNRTHASASAAMLFLAVVALVMPAVFDLTVYGSLTARTPIITHLSVLVAIVLMGTYLASLIFSFKTHIVLLSPESAPLREARLSLRDSLLVLLVVTTLTGFEAELLVSTITAVTKTLALTDFFIGAVIVAIIGNAAEHFSAVTMARKNQMDLAVTIATGSSTQIALFIAPVLVFASLLFGSPLSLVFNAFEIVGIGLAVLALTITSLDGESNWFEGVQLVAVYLILVIVFYYVPVGK